MCLLLWVARHMINVKKRIGMIPGTTTYVLMGTMGEAFINGKKSSFEWVLLGMGLVATIMVTLLISKIVKNSQSHNQLNRY